jgi:serine protease Do
MKRAYILAIGFILTWLSLTIVQFKTVRFSPVTPPLSLKNNPKISQLARNITVRIISDAGYGSGVIIQHQGDTYRVLTNAHVIDNNSPKNYQILTADGRLHQGKLLLSNLGKLDLALLQFTSEHFYQVPEIRKAKKLSVGEVVYGVGFPNWHWINSERIENTHNWGIKAFKLTTGILQMILPKSLKDGYQIGYTNDIATGMSGGSILDKDGKLVGVNGRSKYPLAGISAFKFADGTMPSEGVFREMETLSWGIPIDSFLLMNIQNETADKRR